MWISVDGENLASADSQLAEVVPTGLPPSAPTLPTGSGSLKEKTRGRWGGKPHFSLAPGGFFRARTRRAGGLDAEKPEERENSQQVCQSLAVLGNLSPALHWALHCPGRGRRPSPWVLSPSRIPLALQVTLTSCSGCAQLAPPMLLYSVV